MDMTDTSILADTEARAQELRDALVDKLIADKTITTPRVEAAMRAVQRHVFAAGADLETAYADQALPYLHAKNGVCVASVPAPSTVAWMLEAAEIEPGMRVLEVGSGGYGAALLSHLVEEVGRVVSMDIDPTVTMRAMAGLAQTDYTPIVVVGDAEYGMARFAPYDRIIVTASSWDVPRPWVDDLAPGGRIVMPLEMRGAQRIIAFDTFRGLLRSTAMRHGVCEPMRGAGIRRSAPLELGGAGGVLEFDGQLPPGADALADVLTGERVEMPTGVRVGALEPYDALELYLAVALPRTARLAAGADWSSRGLAPAQQQLPVLASGADSIAYVTLRETNNTRFVEFEFVACGLGPGAAILASELAGHIAFWNVNLRGHGDPAITVHPAGAVTGADDGQHTISASHSTITLSFPFRTLEVAPCPA